ncbi:DUF6339 family protein [Nocardia brasiliensis]|uniref:DUF6339 family protein n=1 Tax=Nocardia brasiliensis TaxID=37326 RepID=UPI003D7884CF
MNQLWPRISHTAALVALQQLDIRDGSKPHSTTRHPQQTFAATGGHRVREREITQLVDQIETVAVEHGYGGQTSTKRLVEFDRQAAEVLYEAMHITSFEASQPGMWTFLSVVAMPGVTAWRFGPRNVERWIATDLTRHMFSRLWWQAFIFGVRSNGSRTDYRLLRSLSESDLNQLTERKSIGGNHRLARAIAAELVLVTDSRRDIVRDLTRRLRRLTPFIDFSALTDDDLYRLVQRLRTAQ